jgi:hypothetical protein
LFLKGIAKKNFLKFVFAISMLKRPQNLKILKHDYGGIVGGETEKHEVLRPFEHISNRDFF